MNIEAYLKKDYVRALVNKNERVDHRKFDEHRQIEIQKSYVPDRAEGSTLVKLGKTSVLVGIKMDTGEPFLDRPEEGVMTVNAELRPTASPYFETGPPREEAVELARVVDRGIRESKAIELEKLFIEENKVWMVFIDIHILDDGGNLIDASGIAAISALLDSRMPKYEEGVIVRGEWDGKLPVSKTPIPCTFVKIGDKILLDPLTDEEYAMDARLTIATTDNNLNAMQKGGAGTFTKDEIQRMVDLAFEKGNEIRKYVE